VSVANVNDVAQALIGKL